MSKQINKNSRIKNTKLIRIDSELHKILKIEAAKLQTTIGKLIKDRLI